jgi:hypothetical protein
MVIDMNDAQLHTLADLKAFLDGTVALDFTVVADEYSGPRFQDSGFICPRYPRRVVDGQAHARELEETWRRRPDRARARDQGPDAHRSALFFRQHRGQDGRAVRPRRASHWGVEAVQRVLDITFREDDCRAHKGHAARNLSAQVRPLGFAR